MLLQIHKHPDVQLVPLAWAHVELSMQIPVVRDEAAKDVHAWKHLRLRASFRVGSMGPYGAHHTSAITLASRVLAVPPVKTGGRYCIIISR